MTRSMQPTIDIRPADTRFATNAGWLESRHCFSFARHHDPSNTHHGLLLVSNDDIVAPRTGFDTHPHQDMEIITWVMSGELEHKDTLGNKGLIYPGLAQRMSPYGRRTPSCGAVASSRARRSPYQTDS